MAFPVICIFCPLFLTLVQFGLCCSGFITEPLPIGAPLTKCLPYFLFMKLRTFLPMQQAMNNNNNNNNNQDNVYGAVIMAEPLLDFPGSFDECRMAPSGRQQKTKPDDLGCESACTGCQNLHPPSPFITARCICISAVYVGMQCLSVRLSRS